MARKTVSVDSLVQRVNRMVKANSEARPENVEGRAALYTLLESVLMETDNYRGFHYVGGGADADKDIRQYYWKG